MEKEQTKEKVAIVKYDGTGNALERAIELCGGFEELKPSHKILLKPNILWAGTKKLPPYGVVTTSTMVDHLLHLLREQGCTDITIGEGTIVNKEMGSNTMRGYDWSGIGKVAKRYGVKLVDFNTEPFEEVRLDEIKVNISRWALESDFLINLPVLKAHRQTKISLGMKNLKGCLALSSKKAFHMHGLTRLIALLNTKIKTSLTIIDGIYGLEKRTGLLGDPPSDEPCNRRKRHLFLRSCRGHGDRDETGGDRISKRVCLYPRTFPLFGWDRGDRREHR
jgi:uncharacterized protein (DUF362 family)